MIDKRAMIHWHQDLIDDRGVDTASGFSTAGQDARFHTFVEQFLRLKNWLHKSVLDYGCGVGDLYARRRGQLTDYTGVDVNPAFIHYFKRRFPNLRSRLHVTDAIVGSFDAVFSSGVFCYRCSQKHHKRLLASLWRATRELMVVNFLTDNPATKVETREVVRYSEQDILQMLALLPDGPKLLKMEHDYPGNITVTMLRKDIEC